MSLRYKIPLILIAALGLYACIDYALQRYFILPTFLEIEQEEARRNLDRCHQALNREIHHLDQFCLDWATWDPTYTFVQTGRPGEVPAHLPPITFANQDLNLFYLLNDAGEVLYGRAARRGDEAIVELPPFLPPQVALTHPLLQRPISGMLVHEQGPMLIAARPVLPSSGEGEPGGTLIVGRLVSDSFLQALRQQIHAHVEMWPYDGRLLPEAAPDRRVFVEEPGVRFVFQDAALQAYSVYPDVYGRPGVLFRVAVPRDILQHGLMAMRLDTIGTVIAALVLLLVLIVLMRRTVTQPLSALTHHLTAIHKSDALPLYEGPRPRGELGHLARELNGMILRLRQDLEHRRNAEAALRESERRLIQADHLAALGEMGASVAHEIRNPLAGISAAVQVMLVKMPEDDPNRDVLLQMQALVQRVERTVRQLLDYAKQWRVQPQPLAPLRLLRTLCEEGELCAKYPSLRISIEGDEAARINADPTLLAQVCTNLMDNAGQAMGGHGTITWRVHQKNGSVVLSLEDTGGGLRPEARDKLFRPFHTTKTHGTGLGLAICRRIMQAHQGSIDLQDNALGGVTVNLHFAPVDA